jgi:hypothetical protein
MILDLIVGKTAQLNFFAQQIYEVARFMMGEKKRKKDQVQVHSLLLLDLGQEKQQTSSLPPTTTTC